MRERKYRVWDMKNRRMISWDQLCDFDPEQLDLIRIMRMTDHYVVMDYTGLEDKLGVEIYEGDIASNGDALYKVDFDLWENGGAYEDYEDGYGWYLEAISQLHHIHEDTSLKGADRYYSVIGNIYENPELLETKS